MDQEKTKLEKTLSFSAITFLVIGFILLGASIVIYLLNYSLDSQKFSEFGEFVGGFIGSLWALSGVLFFYLALSLQRNELALQRKELELTREELEKSAIAHQKSSELLEEQLEVMRENQKMEKKKEERSTEPILAMKGGSKSGKKVEPKLVNLGALIKEPKIKPYEGGYSVELPPMSLIRPNQEFRITVNTSSESQEIFRFTLEYEKLNGQTDSKNYRIKYPREISEIE